MAAVWDLAIDFFIFLGITITRKFLCLNSLMNYTVMRSIVARYQAQMTKKNKIVGRPF